MCITCCKIDDMASEQKDDSILVEHLRKVIPQMKEGCDELLKICNEREEKIVKLKALLNDSIYDEMRKIETVCDDVENGRAKKRVALGDIVVIAKNVRLLCLDVIS